VEDSFGPVIVIEDIEVVGNETTAERIILRALPFAKGDALAAGDPRLAAARYKVLALGYFRDVVLKLSRGSERGKVALTVVVIERGTVVLERIYFGRSDASPWWAGIDLTERNVFGSGIGVGGGFVIAGEGPINGSRSQSAAQLRLDDPSILGTSFGAFLTLSRISASEPFRVRGNDDDGGANNFEAFDYTRIGGKFGVTANLTPLSRLVAGARLEFVDAELPAMPSVQDPNGTTRDVDLHLNDGNSRVVGLSLAFDRDTRPHPILPWSGSRVALVAEAGATWMGGSYDFASFLAQFGKWWPIRSRSHVLSVHLTGGAVVGGAARFDRLFVGDLNKLLTPRELGLVLSTRPALNLLDNRAAESRYGTLGGVAELQYSRRLFRGGKVIYGGDLFVGGGLWALHDDDNRPPRSDSGLSALPVGVFVDAGLRLDTQVGIFELSIANGLGRVPL